jgi:peroxiredoxin
MFRTMVAATLGLLWSVSAFAADKAADFTLRDINGKEVHLHDYAGKVVVLSFWATWCGPCKEEMPHLQKMFTGKGGDLVVLSISTDDARSASKVKPFIMSQGFTFPVLLDREASVIGTYNPSKTLPFTVVVDRQGNLAHVASGYNPGDEKGLETKIDALLAAH